MTMTTTTTPLLEPPMPLELDPAAPPDRQRGLTSARLHPVFLLVEANLATRLRVIDMAAAVGLTMFHFSREFLRLTGVAPYAYVRRRRIARAALLLAGSKLPIVAIAAEVGFNTHSHFTTTFAKHAGMTPGRYRLLYSALPASPAGRRKAPDFAAQPPEAVLLEA